MDDLHPKADGENAAESFPQVEFSEGENASEVLDAPRLIASKTVLKCITDVLTEPLETSESGYASIDDLYFAIRFHDAEAGERMRSLADTVQCDGMPETFQCNRPNSWRFMWWYKIGDCAVRLSIGWIDSSGKTSMAKGSLQFNPNKAHGRSEVLMLMRKIGRFAKAVELKRYDLAIDIPADRKLCRMRKDGRGYRYEDHGNGITEYLGKRNKPGRVKLYDKTKEAGLDKPWTRLELTVDSSWDVGKIVSQFPSVYTWNGSGCDTNTRNWVCAFGLLAAEFLDSVGGTIEPYLRILGKKSADKVMEFLTSPRVEIERDLIEQLRARAHDWEKVFWS